MAIPGQFIPVEKINSDLSSASDFKFVMNRIKTDNLVSLFESSKSEPIVDITKIKVTIL